MPINKIKYNLRNVYYAKLTMNDRNEPYYATPVALPGAVSLSLTPNGEPSYFYADGYAYYTIANNMGYDGDFELAMLPESFLVDILNETRDANGVLLENANTQTAKFALLFEFDGDVRKIRHVFYNCTASRPAIESQTKEESIEVKTEKLTFKASPLPDGIVRCKTGNNIDDNVYRNWYNNVYLPNSGSVDLTLSSLSIDSLTLTPAFNKNVIAYTAATTAATNTITARATDSANTTVGITLNGSYLANDGDAGWLIGTNTVIVTVRNGDFSKQYIITVTRGA